MLALSSPAGASPQTPDVYVYDVGVNGSDVHDIHYWGQDAVSGIAAYSIATQSCNGGDEELDWYDSGGSTLHPVIGQNMFRLKGGRFEHIGQSWLKHGFCAVSETETGCAPCLPDAGCDELGIGCADTYWATLNDGQAGQSKKMVNATTGAHTHGGGSPAGPAAIRGRLQVAVADIDPAQNAGAEWFIEGHYVAADDAQAGADDNNASWRQVNVLAVNNIDGLGNTNPGDPAIYAWRANQPDVEIRVIHNVEGGRNILGTFCLGFTVTDLGNGTWDYEYAVHNLSSDQSAASFHVACPSSVDVQSIGFHDVRYHSGDPYDGTDWPGVHSGGEVSWATTPFATNANANALRWGTLYNFRFVADAPPTRGSVRLGLFKPSVNLEQVIDDVWVPRPDRVPNQVSGPPAPGERVVVNLPFTTGRNGSNANLPVLVELSPAVVGRQWSAGIDLPGSPRSILFVGFSGPAEGEFNHMGELLLRKPVIRMGGELVLAIPQDAGLLGFTFSTQAAVRTEAGWRLTNALDVTIGTSE